VLSEALLWKPDLLLVTGDLSEDFSEESYAFLARTMLSDEIPVVTTPGNHDDAGVLANHFPVTPVDDPRVVVAGDWQLILLNSSVAGEIPGRLTARMCTGLEKALEDDMRPKLIVLHHQPVKVGSHWIDRYPLQETGRLWSILEDRADVRGLLWGHIHHSFTAKRGEIRLMGAPSTVANSIPFEEKFRLDPAGPACRWIKLGPGSELATGILRSSEGLNFQEATARE
jgi:Icc protein